LPLVNNPTFFQSINKGKTVLYSRNAKIWRKQFPIVDRFVCGLSNIMRKA
jgi:hypothetical protein